MGMAVAAVVNVAGYTFDLYGRISGYDKAMHACTIGTLAPAPGVLRYGRALTGATDNRPLLIVAVAALGVALRAPWEIAEWAYRSVSHHVRGSGA